MSKILKFQKPIVIYLPCYNTESAIVNTLRKIPEDFHDKIECLIIDNNSDDSTSDKVSEEVEKGTFLFKIHLIKTNENLGYAGSQKLAYSLITMSDDVEHVIMLHGDGQYDPALMNKFLPLIGKNYGVIFGYRDKSIYHDKEETPIVTYLIIKILSWIENILTGFDVKEWHNGFVLYQNDFLRKIPLQLLSDFPHIDGELIIAASILQEKTTSIPIYKRYKDHVPFQGLGRIKHVFTVFKVMYRYKRKQYHRMLKDGIPSVISDEFEIIL